MLNGPNSCASCRVSPTTACFALQYAWMPVNDGCNPAPELMLMIRPPPARFMPGAAARHSVNAALTLMSKIMFQSSSATPPAAPGPARPRPRRCSPGCRSAARPASRSAQSRPPAAARSRKSSARTVMPPRDAVSASPSRRQSVANTCAPSRAKVQRNLPPETMTGAGDRDDLAIEPDDHPALLRRRCPHGSACHDAAPTSQLHQAIATQLRMAHRHRPDVAHACIAAAVTSMSQFRRPAIRQSSINAVCPQVVDQKQARRRAATG